MKTATMKMRSLTPIEIAARRLLVEENQILPEKATCEHCANFRRCTRLRVVIKGPKQVYCEWSPSRFRLHKDYEGTGS